MEATINWIDEDGRKLASLVKSEGDPRQFVLALGVQGGVFVMRGKEHLFVPMNSIASIKFEVAHADIAEAV